MNTDFSSKSKKGNFDFIIFFIENLNEPWGIKDLDSRHVFMNKAARYYTNTPDKFNIEGNLDVDFPVGWSDLAVDLQKHDKLVQSSNRCVAVIETHYWNNSALLLPCISEKMPIHDSHNNFIGILWNAKKLKRLSCLEYINMEQPAIFNTEPSVDIFTKSELGVIFFLLQRYSSKEIAKKLNISPRTVDKHRGSIYWKTKTHSLNQFYEYCRNIGLDNYIPYEFITKGVRFI